MEMEEKLLDRAKLQSEKLAAKVELERLQLERARVECENIKVRAEVQSTASSQAVQGNVVTVNKTLNKKDCLGNYLLRLERYVTITTRDVGCSA